MDPVFSVAVAQGLRFGPRIYIPSSPLWYQAVDIAAVQPDAVGMVKNGESTYPLITKHN